MPPSAGLGGSGVLNLLITNLGFGEPVWTLRGGQRSPQVIGGTEPETIEFFIDEGDESRLRIGSSTVWAWPFPEVCTVGEALRAQGSTDVKMGTAPELWNVILVAMAKVQPSPPPTCMSFTPCFAAISWLCVYSFSTTTCTAVKHTCGHHVQACCQASRGQRRCLGRAAHCSVSAGRGCGVHTMEKVDRGSCT